MASSSSKASMALEAWRHDVPHGAYMQRIRLSIRGDRSQNAPASAVSATASPSSQEPLETSQEQSDDSTPTAATGAEVADANVVELPPFESACLTGGDRMALNVGGPVWAMDWLPQPSTASSPPPPDSTDVPQKRGRRKPAASGKARRVKGGQGKKSAVKTTKSANKGAKKKAQPVKKGASASKKSASKGKCNGEVETLGATTAPSNTSSSSEADGEHMGESEALQWRYLALAAHPPCQVDSDGKLVKTAAPDHYYAVQEGGRNLIQIWAVPMHLGTPRPSPNARKGGAGKSVDAAAKPRLVYAIDHSSNVAWDLQWCPLAEKLPHQELQSSLLGVLAVCFGDGSLRVFEVPKPPIERLQTQPQSSKDAACIVETLAPVVVAKLPHILQLSLQWSPHKWNLLLTGGSDGSVSLWNIEAAMRERESVDVEPPRDKTAEPLEPQRRYQDADTIGKQEPFDWGRGWVAIRAVAWSPFDENLFATTGNDSVFKVWDIREPRLCLRSHRIRSTWGLTLLWMNHTSIQISGDQGSIYIYDILTGSYQKLHFHPQIDSPVWDLQFGRHGATPLLLSSCTSGSIRAAPGKKLYRAPQNCVEICRLSGRKDANVEQPYKELSVSFDKHTILGSSDAVSPAAREFCERDAALHRLRLTSTTAGEYPCYLAAAGHAGLVLLLELQDDLDNLITRYFLPPSKKIGRPKKIFAATGSHRVPKKPSGKKAGGVPIAAVSAWRKNRTLGSFAKVMGTLTSLSKDKRKRPKAKLEASKVLRKGKKKATLVVDDDDVEDVVDEEEEAEYESDEDEEEVSDSELSRIMGEDSSDDDRVSVSGSEDHADEERGGRAAPMNAEEVRLMSEYQMDLSEEDAIALAIQMSELKLPAPSTGAGSGGVASTSKATPGLSMLPSKDAARSGSSAKNISGSGKTKAKTKAPAEAKTGKGKKRALPSKDTKKRSVEAKTNSNTTAGKKTTTVTKPKATSAGSSNGADELKGPASISSTTAQTGKKKVQSTASTSAAQKTKTRVVKKEPKSVSPKPSSAHSPAKTKTKQSPCAYQDVVVDQTAAFQLYEYQLGLTEEDAIKEAIRLSEAGDKRRSTRPKHPAPQRESINMASGGSRDPVAVQQQLATAATSATRGSSGMKAQTSKAKGKQPQQTKKSQLANTDREDQQGPHTPHQLQFSPLIAGTDGKSSAVPATEMIAEVSAAQGTTAAVGSADARARDAAAEPAQRTLSAQEKKQETKKTVTTTTSTPKKPSPTRAAKVAVAGSEAATAAKSPEAKRPPKRPRSTATKPTAGSTAAKKRKTTTTATTGRQRRGAAATTDGSMELMSEEDALLMALKMSEVEY